MWSWILMGTGLATALTTTWFCVKCIALNSWEEGFSAAWRIWESKGESDD